MDSPLSCYESESYCGGEKGLWKLDDPVGYREFWKRSHWDVLSVFIHQRDAVLLDQAVLCSLLSASKDARTAILQGSCRGQACITFEAKSDLKRVRRFSLWLQRHAQVIGELHLQLGDKWSTIADLQVRGTVGSCSCTYKAIASCGIGSRTEHCSDIVSDCSCITSVSTAVQCTTNSYRTQQQRARVSTITQS
jgi:hypothetical protein